MDKAAESLGGDATPIRGDVSDLDFDRVFEGITERGHGVDGLFANAGGGAFSTMQS